MGHDEGALRKKVEQTQAKVDELRAKYAAKQDDNIGRQLQHARVKASEALADLWAAAPNEKPPTQRLL